jgi:anti-anti-sigma factor
MPVQSTINTETRTLKISITGNFDFSAHKDFRNTYHDADTSLNVELDMRNTEYMDSSALSMLLLLDEHFKDKKVVIVACSDFVKQILEIANFHHKFDIK